MQQQCAAEPSSMFVHVPAACMSAVNTTLKALAILHHAAGEQVGTEKVGRGS